LCVQERTSHPNVGFRRKNLPYLLAKYFLDMGKVFDEIFALLKPGAFAFVVIGNNHTRFKNKRIQIPTDRFLGLIGERKGFELVESIPMEMLVSRDIFKKNAVARETILFLRKPG